MFIVFFYIDVHALDLVKLPKKEQKVTNRKKTKKVDLPDWHLTGKETMQYIQEAHTRQEEKQKKEEKYEKIKTEAVKNAKKKWKKWTKKALKVICLMRTKWVNKHCPLVVIPDVSVFL